MPKNELLAWYVCLYTDPRMHVYFSIEAFADIKGQAGSPEADQTSRGA
jgi:hypothetical protein